MQALCSIGTLCLSGCTLPCRLGQVWAVSSSWHDLLRAQLRLPHAPGPMPPADVLLVTAMGIGTFVRQLMLGRVPPPPPNPPLLAQAQLQRSPRMVHTGHDWAVAPGWMTAPAISARTP